MGTNVLDSLSIPDVKDSSHNVECTFQSGSGFSPKNLSDPTCPQYL